MEKVYGFKYINICKKYLKCKFIQNFEILYMKFQRQESYELSYLVIQGFLIDYMMFYNF